MAAKKKKTLPSNAVTGSQKNHKARGKDPMEILINVVKSSGYEEAWRVAKELDNIKLPGSWILQRFETQHREIVSGGEIKWVSGPAGWMRKAMEAYFVKQKIAAEQVNSPPAP